MGGCVPSQMSEDDDDVPAPKDKKKQPAKKKGGKKFKLLLLGAGEAGKSTIAKQLKILHLAGFTRDEVENYRQLIHQSIITNMKQLIRGAQELNVVIEHSAEVERILAIEMDEHTLMNAQTIKDIDTLWNQDQGVKNMAKRATEIHVTESAAYFFDNLSRIAESGYSPNYEDILRSRRLTVGAEELEFAVDGVVFHVIDVGGQKGEREKWIEYFQNNDAVIFFVALSEYDQKLAEDNTTMRMEESLKLFSDVCNHQWFANAAIILFLNKSDIFREKIAHIPLTTGFPNYTGPNEFEPASEYIKNQFLDRVGKKKKVYPYITCATNTENFKNVFAFCKDIIVNKALTEQGIL